MKPPTPLLEVVSSASDADPEMEGLLRAARESAEPRPAHFERVSRALSAALPVSLPASLPASLTAPAGALAAPAQSAPPASGTGSGAVPDARASAGASRGGGLTSGRLAGGLLIGGLAIGGLAIGGLGFWLGQELGYSQGIAHALREQASQVAARELSPSNTAVLERRTDPEGTPAFLRTPEPVTPAPARPPAAAPLPAAAPAPAPAPARRSRAAVPERPRASESAAPRLTFRQALEQLRRAQQQLRGGRAALSLLLLSELDRAAGPLLLEEREATRVLALCAAGEEKAARAAAVRLERSSPGSIYAMRLSTSCAGAGALEGHSLDPLGGAERGE